MIYKTTPEEPLINPAFNLFPENKEAENNFRAGALCMLYDRIVEGKKLGSAALLLTPQTVDILCDLIHEKIKELSCPKI